MAETDRVIADLQGQVPSAEVSVIVRPTSSQAVQLDHLDPKQFASAGDYRAELIARQRAAVRPGSSKVVSEAQLLGLDASAASSINAVLVEGKAGAILDLLSRIDFTSVNFSR